MKASKRVFINEIFLIRAVACIAVVVIHTLTVSVMNYDLPSTTEGPIRYVQLLLMFATPTFILISEILVSHSYREGTPKGFLVKRMKYILLPYLFMGTVYALYDLIVYSMTAADFFNHLKDILLLGRWHGYFILIIMQFYLLHLFFQRFLLNFSPGIVLFVAAILNFSYLGIVNFVKPFGFSNAFYIWYDFSRIPFLGWILYFTVAFYIGRDIERFRHILSRWKIPVLIGTIFMGSLLLYFRREKILTMISSNRVDVIVYTILVLLLLFVIGTWLERIPRIIVLISQYSFGIYLLHPFFLQLLNLYYSKTGEVSLLTYSITSFIAGVAGPIVVTFLLNLTPVGAFTVGKIGVKPRPAN
ncbi:acyltransferase family protein [Pseudalkalibacillus sp. SCS-8]|uniref:acyltransferase family protein n=1 Tax=Pseudalkalibacillus nanhaiensis TaxID=3115291 RepID=UPI0032DB5F5E